MRSALSLIAHGLENSALMAYEVWWALVLGFAVSAIVQAWVPRASIERRLSGEGIRPAVWATGLGAASSSCSYAAIAIGRSLFAKGASLRAALAFQFASTNLVWELGLVLWLLLGWQFTVAELVGGLVLIAIMWISTRAFVSRRLEQDGREHARAADAHEHHTADARARGWRARFGSAEAWSDVAANFRSDWHMLYREILVGFLLAGFIGLIHPSAFDALFLHDAPAWIRVPENAVVGPLIAVLSFVCSVGNVPLAAVLWSGGSSFAGVIAFVFADLIILPIVAIYRSYYGTRVALRITALLFVTMVAAALVVDLAFSSAGLVPAHRPTHAQLFTGVRLDYKLALDVLGGLIFASLALVPAQHAAWARDVPAWRSRRAS